jgi:hypothetical protein
VSPIAPIPPPIPPNPDDDLDDSRFRVAIAGIMADARRQAAGKPPAELETRKGPGGSSVW